MNPKLEKFAYQSTSIDDYFTNGYNLKLNNQIRIELTEMSSKYDISQKRIVFEETNSTRKIQSINFSALDFLNLLYHEADYIKNDEKSPLLVQSRLREIPLDENERLYFLERLSDVLKLETNNPRLEFVVEQLHIEYLSIWHNFFGTNLVEPTQAVTERTKDDILEKYNSLPNTDEKLKFLITVKHHISNLDYKSDSDSYFLNKIQALINYNKEIREFQGQSNNETEQQTATSTKENCCNFSPIFNTEHLDEIYIILKKYFNTEQHNLLYNLLKTGINTTEQLLLFLEDGNKLADAIKKLFDIGIIAGCKKVDIEHWIANNFQYRKNKIVTSYTENYIHRLISSTQYPCKNPINEIETLVETKKRSNIS